MEFGAVIGYGVAGKPSFWLGPARRWRPEPGGPHRLPGRRSGRGAGVLRRRGARTGAEVLHEPRLWPEYHPDYYGAFVRDPDGNNVEAVCHTPG